MSRKGSAIMIGASLTASWRADVSQDQMRKAAELLSIFGLTRVYSDDPMPVGDPNQFLPLARSN
jgi:hypothetical protein